MERRCAWCGRDLDGGGATGGNGASPPDVEVTHGICPACYDRLSTGTGIPIREFIASLKKPVFVVDSEHTIGMLNQEALELLGIADADALGERTGYVFDCENAHLPGGCGRTIHCSGCTIRQAVAHTHLTGEPKLAVPATLRVVDDPGVTDVEMVISTARIGDRILLKIDRYKA